jgi:maleate cis-trans isomerase
MAATSDKNVGVIFPDEGAYEYELIDDPKINRWLHEHAVENVNYISARTQGGKASSIAACEQLASEAELARAAEYLKTTNCDSVVWACTSASFFRGLSYACWQSEHIGKHAAAPAASTSTAMLAALEKLGATKIDIMMSYMPEVAETFVAFVKEAGHEVGSVRHMVCAPHQRSFDLDYRTEISDFVSTIGESDSPILVPSTSLNSLDLVDDLERIARRPVLTANQVTLWSALRLAGCTQPLPQAGKLFSLT